MNILNFIKKTNTIIDRAWLLVKIAAKLVHDKRYLPLTTEHWELYLIIHQLYWRELHDFPNLINCRDFNDRIQWLKLFDQRPEMINCSDKILVRDYIKERVGKKYLVKLYQIHDHFSQIEFKALPNAFVIKVNHDSGTVILVRDKSKFDYHSAATRIESALQKKYGWANGEWAYSYIQPKVFIEEYIEPENQVPPPDYKFYCVDGVVNFCHFIYNRGFGTKEQIVDRRGNSMGIDLYTSFMLGNDFSKPIKWDEMVLIAEKIGRGFKCVRVDMFCTKERIVVGEMTFWPMAGIYKGEGQKKLGELLNFDRRTYQPFLLPKLNKSYIRK